MIPRILEIAENGRYIAKQRGALIIKDSTDQQSIVPIDDIGIMMISAMGATVTKETLVSLAERGAVTVLCNNRYLPSAMVTPVVTNYEMPLRVKFQLDATEPLKKRFWQALIKAKLLHQGRVLTLAGNPVAAKKLFYLCKEVESGDPHNRESVGARYYWKNLFGKEFTRSREGPWPNKALNYGYTILRSAVIRAIYCVGILPMFGIHHENSTNPFPLADDLMEPYRPIVDYLVFKEIAQNTQVVTPEIKRAISKVLWLDLSYNGQTTPLYNAIEQICYSLVKSYKAKKCILEIPEFVIENEDT
ncbi:MAG: type II CRISPR-associated endonuclease Cas1 [Spirochaetota bacterium]|jgi:CRISPR-associated protein Cas1